MLLSGSNVPENKPAILALQSIYGIGEKSALAICNLIGINSRTKLNQLNPMQADLLVKNCRRILKGNRKREVIESIKALVKIRCYRGVRHINALPLRGQRTRTNGFTSKNLLSKSRALLR